MRPIASLGVLMMFWSCSGVGQPPAKNATVMTDSLELDAKIRIEGEALVLDYRVTNHAQRDVYLLNRLFRSTPSPEFGTDVIYIELNAEHRAVWLSKRLAELPKGKSVTAPVAPFVTPVRAGASFHETVRVPLPVREYRQYDGPPPGSEPVRREYELAWFSLGYYWRVPGTEEKIIDVQGAPVVQPKAPWGAKAEFGELKSPSFRLRIPAEEMQSRR